MALLYNVCRGPGLLQLIILPPQDGGPSFTAQCGAWCYSHRISIPGSRKEEGMDKETERVGQLSLGESPRIYTSVYISSARMKFQGKPCHDTDWEMCSLFFLGDLAQILFYHYERRGECILGVVSQPVLWGPNCLRQ